MNILAMKNFGDIYIHVLLSNNDTTITKIRQTPNDLSENILSLQSLLIKPMYALNCRDSDEGKCM